MTATHDMPAEVLSLVADQFRLLSDPTRLKLMLALRGGERGVTAIAEAAGTSQANASKHLAALHDAGMLTRRRDGGYVYYQAKGRVPYLLVDAVCKSLDVQVSERQALLSGTQPHATEAAA